MAAMKIGATDVTPIVPQTGKTIQAAREVGQRVTSPSRPKAYNPYTTYRGESITCRETAGGTYEAILGNDPVVHEQGNRKGQIVDLWI